MVKYNNLSKWVFGAAIALLPVSSMYAVKATDVLPDNQSYNFVNGVQARKGSIVATIKNVVALNQLNENGKLIPGNSELEEILVDQRELSETLYAVGLFDLFSIKEWLIPACGEGRVFVGVLVLQVYPDLMGREERCLLEGFFDTYSPALQAEIVALLNE